MNTAHISSDWPGGDRLAPACFSASLWCFVEAQLVGHLCCSCAFETCDVDNFDVKRSYRRQGYGRFLLNRLEFLCRQTGQTRILLEVSEANTPALNLYFSHGFERISVRHHYYKTGENALILEKILCTV